MKRLISTIALLLSLATIMYGQESPITIEVSDQYTTHIAFTDHIIYTDLGQATIIAGTAESNKNILRIKATEKNITSTNATVILRSGKFFTFYVAYSQEPSKLFYDFRQLTPTDISDESSDTLIISHPTEEEIKNSSLDTLSYISSLKRALSHLGERKDKVSITIWSIYQSENSTYITYNIKNNSNLPVKLNGPIHTYKQTNDPNKKGASQSIEITPYKKEKTEVTVASGEDTTLTYEYRGLALSDTQQLTVYMYTSDNRTFLFPINQEDLIKSRKIKL